MEREIFCGDWRNGKILCPEHLQQAIEEYPQGWSYYPGDICVHGKYTGGSGPDLMCWLCEMGYTRWVDDPAYTLRYRFRMVNGEWSHWLDSFYKWRESEITSDDEAASRWAANLWSERIFNIGLPDLEFQAFVETRGYWDEEK